MWLFFNIFICHLLIQMSKPLTNQQNASLIKHLRKRHNVLMEPAELKQVLAEIRRELGHLEFEEESEPNFDVTERIFA